MSRLRIDNLRLWQSSQAPTETGLLIENGVVEAFFSDSAPHADQIWDAGGAVAVPGLVDAGVVAGAPGLEHIENFETLTLAAMAGGFTDVAVWPTGNPVAHDQTGIRFVSQQHMTGLSVHPIGAITRDAAGSQMAELYDMAKAGARAFADGRHSIASAALLLRALEYARPGGLKIWHHPFDQSLAAGGQMHEGVVSTTMGLAGIPSLAEEVVVQRDIALVRYSGAPLHLCGISTATSVAMVRAAKAEGLPITASCYVLNAVFDHSALRGFNAQFKVLPPLRTASDVAAIQAALADGILDALQSGHQPWDAESKDLEFAYAKPGAAMLDAAVVLSLTQLKPVLGFDRWLHLWTAGPRAMLGLAELPPLQVGQQARLTFLDTEHPFTYTAAHLKSKSRNSPLFGHHMQSRVAATLVGHHLYINE
jgi:dihydroorotase